MGGVGFRLLYQVIPSYLWGMFYDPQWMLETKDSTEPMDIVLFPICTYL